MIHIGKDFVDGLGGFIFNIAVIGVLAFFALMLMRVYARIASGKVKSDKAFVLTIAVWLIPIILAIVCGIEYATTNDHNKTGLIIGAVWFGINVVCFVLSDFSLKDIKGRRYKEENEVVNKLSDIEPMKVAEDENPDYKDALDKRRKNSTSYLDN